MNNDMIERLEEELRNLDAEIESWHAYKEHAPTALVAARAEIEMALDLLRRAQTNMIRYNEQQGNG